MNAQLIPRKNQARTLAEAGLYLVLALAALNPMLASADDRVNPGVDDMRQAATLRSSPILPFSADRPGIRLNQAFLLEHRANESGRPYWSTELKQYRLGMTTDADGKNQIYLADPMKDGKSSAAAVPEEKSGAMHVWLTCTGENGCPSTALEAFSADNSRLLVRLAESGMNADFIERVKEAGKEGGKNKAEGKNCDVVLSDAPRSRHTAINHGQQGIVVYYFSSDGMLHAVKAGNVSATGTRLWSFISSEQYENLGRLYKNQPQRDERLYAFDGNIGVYQSADLKKTHLFVSLRRGGRAIYAFDVSDPVNPNFLWKRSHRNPGFSELGLSFSEPRVAAIKRKEAPACDLRNAATYQPVLIFGAGYDANEEDKQPGQVRTPQMGRGVFVLDAANGNLVKFLQPTNSGKKHSFAADVALLDTDSDACIDRIYAADTGGNIHRYDLPNADAHGWQGYHLAQLGDIEEDGGNNDRKFLHPVDAVIGYEGTGQVIYLMGGTGDSETPHDTTVQNHFFMIKDTISVSHAGDLPAAYPRKLANLDQVTVFDSRSDQVIDPYAAEFKGWYLPLSASGEKAVNAPLTVAGVTYFGTNIPKPLNKQCAPNLGEARGYALTFLNGTAAAGDRNQDGSVNERDLFAEFIGGGLPPSPVTGVVKIEEKYVRFVIGSGGTGGRASAIEGHQVQVNPNSNRTRVYWYFKKD